jgi:hypothetical protein
MSGEEGNWATARKEQYDTFVAILHGLHRFLRDRGAAPGERHAYAENAKNAVELSGTVFRALDLAFLPQNFAEKHESKPI